MNKSKNYNTLSDFVLYCSEHPEERFWQALRNWVGVAFIFVGDKLSSEAVGGRDTFYWEGKYEQSSVD